MSFSDKLYYSFLKRDGYDGNAPEYFDPTNFNWSRELENNSQVIIDELNQFINSGKELWPYFDQKIVSKKNSWKTIPFEAWGVKMMKNRNQAPKTIQLLNKIPGVVSASFNMLDAHSEILPHNGDTEGIMRCHLGLIVPGNLPEIGFEVNKIQKQWEQGKLLMFCDAHLHKAWNHTNEQRYILLFDVIRPEYFSKKRTICSKVLASLFLQLMNSKIKILEKLPFVIQKTLFFIAYTSAFLVVPIINWLANLLSQSSSTN